jgi:site-specific DNA recombinase
MFAGAHLLAIALRELGKAEPALRSILAGITIRADRMEVLLHPNALGIQSEVSWAWTLPLPERRSFREARLRIDADTNEPRTSNDLIGLVAEAMAAQRLVLASPELSLAQLAKREGRCRTQLARLLRLSWLSPRIIEAIAEGTQPKGLTRRSLLICDLPAEWSVQERIFRFAA